MSDDDVRRIFDKLDSIGAGQVRMEERVTGQGAMLFEVRQDVKTLQATGPTYCVRGEEHSRQIASLMQQAGNGKPSIKTRWFSATGVGAMLPIVLIVGVSALAWMVVELVKALK